VAIRRRAAARSPRSAASRRVASAARTAGAMASGTASANKHTYGPGRPPIRASHAPGRLTTPAFRDISDLRSDLRERAATVADLLHRDVVAVEQRHQQVGEAGVLRVLHVL